MALTKGERGFADYLIYSHMPVPGVIATKNGAYMMAYRYIGPDMGSSTVEEIEHLVALTNSAMRRLGNGWMVHYETVRKPSDDYPENHFTEPTNILIDMEREAQHKSEGAHFETFHYMFFTYLPPAIEKRGWYQNIIKFFGMSENENVTTENQTIDYMEGMVNDLLDVLGSSMKMMRIKFHPLADANNENEIAGYDETMALLNYFICGRLHPFYITPSHIAYIDTMLARDAILANPMQINNQYVSCVSLVEYPLETYPGMLEHLMNLPYEIRWSNRFIFMDFKKAEDELNKARRKWVQKVRGFISQIMGIERGQVNQDALHMVGDTDNALEELNAGWVGYGKHTSTVIARGSTAEEAEEIAHEIVKVFERNGFPSRIEKINAFEAFLGSLPGHGYENVRKPYINTLNLMHIVPLTNEWSGERYNPSPEIAKHYIKEGIASPPPSLLQATSRGATPFRLNVHVSDVGHTLILGPTGSGKSTLLALIVSQFERYRNAQVFVFDKGYSIYPLCMALRDSVHYDLGSENKKISMYPLAEIDTINDQGIAAEWLESMLILQGGEITPPRRTAIFEAIKILAASTCFEEEKASKRTITDYISTLQDETLREIFSYYALGNTGEMLDGKSNDIRYSKTTVFELEHLFEMDKKMVVPVFMHVFKQIEKRILSAYESAQSGRPSLIVIDEAWLALSEPVFAAKIKEWLKVLRKNNCAVILATQSLGDIVKSPITDAVFDSCETRILLPNPNALSESMKDLYMKLLALNEQQVSMIARSEKKRDYFYACETINAHRLFSLALGPVALSFTGASGKEDLNEIRKLQEEYHDMWPVEWLKQRGLGKQADIWMNLYKEKKMKKKK